MAAAKKTTARKSTPKAPEPVTYKLDPRPSGYSNQHLQEGSYGMWCKIDPVPEFVSHNQNEHVYIYASDATYFDANDEKVVGQWASDPSGDGGGDKAKRTGLNLSNATLDRKAMTLTLKRPADQGANRFEDTPENRQRNKAHVAAIRKLIDTITDLGGRQQTIDAINAMVQEKTVIVKASMSDDEIDQKVQDVKDALTGARMLEEAVSGLPENDREAALRHMAHLFNIKKGVTRLR